MPAVVGVDAPGDQPVWQLDVSVLFQGAEPNTTAEFTANLTMAGPTATHDQSTTPVEEFMGMIAQAIGGISGRTCYVTLNKVELLNTPVIAI